MGVSPCPDCSAMHTELLRQNGHADPIGAGCSHSVHFVLSQPCSSASPWLCRRRDEWVVGLTYRLDSNPRPLIPRGNKPLNPWSSVPAALHCFHHGCHKECGPIDAVNGWPEVHRGLWPDLSHYFGPSAAVPGLRAACFGAPSPLGGAKRPLPGCFRAGVIAVCATSS